VGRDFWILIVPICAAFAGFGGSFLTENGTPLGLALMLIGVHFIVHCRRLALYTGYAQPWGGRGFHGEPQEPWMVAGMGLLMLVFGSGLLAFEIADFLGFMETDRRGWKFRLHFEFG
jgi:hypothetical protein